ncbi:hypothetical protein P8C59_003312 [Phyllachora maydis]|uniref:SHSP domain-containing protein n=1 Tax=Phyllachora maydis TaxID=1825666 RepID=A0AAD9M935_9PEZI|nr:hypothetical protein P8C59_003312 [Phyllachora maydis]
MSLFRNSLYAPETSFTPLFRLLNDFDNYNREVQGDAGQDEAGRRGARVAVRSFNPKFDVREVDNAYELHGELAGLAREHVTIEFTDPQTIVIRGKIERSYSSGPQPHAGENGAGSLSSSSSHKATVEDEEAEKAKTQTAVTKHAGQDKVKGPAEKYWVSERSIGEFSRSFSFPTRIEQDDVSANLKDGVLTVVVPKAKKHETRRIAVN